MPRWIVVAHLTLLTACAIAPREPGSPDAVPPHPDARVEPPPDAASPMLWLLTGDPATSTNRLYAVDATTFAIRHHVVLPYPGPLWELAGASADRAYAIDRDLDRLVAIDLAAGTILATTPLAGDMLQNGRGFGTAPDGTLWGIFAGTLARVDPITGALSHEVAVELGSIAEALEGCGAHLYMTSRESGPPRGEKLYVVDRGTGDATLRGPIGTTPIDIDTLACRDDALYGVDTDPELGKTLYRIDPATGAPALVIEFAVEGDINGIHAPATDAVGVD